MKSTFRYGSAFVNSFITPIRKNSGSKTPSRKNSSAYCSDICNTLMEEISADKFLAGSFSNIDDDTSPSLTKADIPYIPPN